MRLFGTPGGSLNLARSTYWFTPPFDLSFVTVAASTRDGPPAVFDFQEVQLPGAANANANPNAAYAAEPRRTVKKTIQRRGDPRRALAVTGVPFTKTGP